MKMRPADNHACRGRMKFGVGVEQNGTAHGETKGTDTAGRRESRTKQRVSC